MSDQAAHITALSTVAPIFYERKVDSDNIDCISTMRQKISNENLAFKERTFHPEMGTPVIL